MQEVEIHSALNEFEMQMIKGDDNAARSALRKLIFNFADIPIQGPISNAVRVLANRPQPPNGVASVLLRAIAWDCFPKDKDENHLSRNVVIVVEKGLPGLSSFLKLHEKSQNFEKYEILTRVKNWVDGQLVGLSVPYTSLPSLLTASRSILSSLAHGRLMEFGIIYKIPEVKDAVSSICSNLEQVSKIAVTLAADIETCEHTINDAVNFVEKNPSFITVEFLKPFLICASKLLHEFVASHRDKFTAFIDKGWPSETLLKRYPLLDAGRDLRILVPFKSGGRGAATDVRVKVLSDSQEIMFLNENIVVGSVSPGKFSIALDAHVVDPSPEVSIILEIEWGEVGTAEKQSAIFDIRILAQASDINWDAYTYADPYGTGPAEGARFVGRQEQVQALVARMLRRPMEPSYITGQKRVGKTSLAIASVEQARELDPKKKLSWLNILWGEIAHEDPRTSLKQLGEKIEEFIIENISNDISIEKGNYDGSLSPLMKLSAIASKLNPDHRFIVIIDEFDEMPQELYLQGNLADTAFGNIRAITTTRNICLLLVGGENMPFVMDRQGQKLNKFSRVDLTYFERSSEWDDYVRLVREPSAGFLEWHEDAIVEIYNLTNGNPYFSKIICSKVYARALRERDVDITSEEVLDSVNSEISRLDDNLFAHLWQDGVFAPVDEREPIVLKRKRVLVALARCIRAGLPVTISNMCEQKNSSTLIESELRIVLSDFISRKVLVETDGHYRTVLPIFGLWLVDVGLTRLASDALSQNLAADAQRAEDEACVLSEELVSLTKSWPTYRGRHIGSDEVRSWLNQRSNGHDQRALFNILKATHFLSDADILERIRGARLTILGIAEAAVRVVEKKKAARRNDIVITYVDGEGKSGQKYASSYAEENYIATAAILPPSNFNEAYRQHALKHGVPKIIVIIDDMVGTGRSLAINMKNFHDTNIELLLADQPLVLAFALLATSEGHRNVLREFSELSYDKIDFRAGEILDETTSLFSDPKGIFATVEERDRAKALAIEIGVSIYKKAPLGYGNQSLNIVFPTTVPNNSLPLLHSRSKGTGNQWRPLFERLVN